MARKSRKNTGVTETAANPASRKTFSAALYARISVETERKREADTIGNQLQLLKDFVTENPDIEIYDIYSDEGDIIRPSQKSPEFPGEYDDSIQKDSVGKESRYYLERR